MTNSITFPGSIFWPSEPTAHQKAALLLYQVPDLFYGGAAGGGKSVFLLMGASAFAHLPNWNALILRKTYADLIRPDALIDVAEKWWVPNPNIKYDSIKHRFTFPSGATIGFGHLSDSRSHFSYQGGAYTFIGIDEASQIPFHQIEYLSSRVRKTVDNPAPLQFRLASNPGDISHDYLKARFVSAPNTPSSVFVPCKLDDNPHLDRDEYEERLSKLDPITAAQLRDGDWDAEQTTNFFQVEKIKWVDSVPDKPWEWVRAWDLAATKEEPGKDPDFTSGALVGHYDGEFCIPDIKFFKQDPASTEEIILMIAGSDGRSVGIIIEVEGGASGKFTDVYFAKKLIGYPYYGKRPIVSKKERARGLASAMRNELVYCVNNGTWRQEFLKQLRGFGLKGVHDDIPDSISKGIDFFANQPRTGVW